MKLRITIEAEHEESQSQPIYEALAEFVGQIERMGFSAPEISLDLDYHDEVQKDGTEEDSYTRSPAVASFDPSTMTVSTMRDAFRAVTHSPEQIQALIDAEMEGKNRDTAVQVLKQAYDKAVQQADV